MRRSPGWRRKNNRPKPLNQWQYYLVIKVNTGRRGLTRESIAGICYKLGTVAALALDTHIKVSDRLSKVHADDKEGCES